MLAAIILTPCSYDPIRYGAGSMVAMTDPNKVIAKTWIASNIGAYGGTAFAAPLLTATGILKKQVTWVILRALLHAVVVWFKCMAYSGHPGEVMGPRPSDVGCMPPY